MPLDPKPGGTDILDLSGNGMGVDINSDVEDADAVGVVADDSFGSMSLGATTIQTRAAIIQVTSIHPSANGLFYVTAGALLTISIIWRNDAAHMDADTGLPPIGTTGTDGHCLIRACANGRVYFENRLGVAINVRMLSTGLVS